MSERRGIKRGQYIVHSEYVRNMPFSSRFSRPARSNGIAAARKKGKTNQDGRKELNDDDDCSLQVPK